MAMVRDEEETIDDTAESTVIKKIIEGDEQSAKWWLARRRRKVFGDNLDLTTKGEALPPENIVQVIVHASDEETKPDEPTGDSTSI
jgi:hypothetical protein